MTTTATIISIGPFSPLVPAPSGSDTAATGDLTIQSNGVLAFDSLPPYGLLLVHGTVKVLNQAFIYLGKGSIILKDSVAMNGGGTFQSDSGTITLEGARWDIKPGASFTPGMGTVIFQGTTNQTLTGNITFNNLVVNTLDTVTFAGKVVVNGNLTVAAGSTVVVPANDTLKVYGTVSGDGLIIGTQTGPLPVEMTSISAVEKENGVALRWSTATETNNYGFEVERAIASTNVDLRDWTKLGFVKGAGTSSSYREYSFADGNVSPGLYNYRIKQVNNDGTFKYGQLVQVEVDIARGIFALAQNYPNPFNPTTEIKFSVAKSGKTVVEVFNVIGQRVAILFDRAADAGQYYRVTFSGSSLPSGLYFVRLQSGSSVTSRKMTLLK